MIQSTNSLNDHQLLEAKALIATCRNYDGTFRDPYLSNMLNFDPNMPAFFLCYEKGELVGLLTVYADDQDVDVAILVTLIIVVRELHELCIEVLRKKRHLIQLSL